MALFGRKRQPATQATSSPGTPAQHDRPRTAGALVPSVVLDQLPSFGKAAWDAKVTGRPIVDPRFGWDNFFSGVADKLPSEPARVIAEIATAAGEDELARFGAYALIAELDPAAQDERFLALMDTCLQMMHDRQLSSGHLSRIEADRWIGAHGDLRASFDGLVEVRPPEDAATSLTLAAGDQLMVARMGPSDLDNQFWIERLDGVYGVYSMRQWDSADVTLTRCAEEALGRWEAIDGVLRSIGEYLRRRPYWAHEALEPYFLERRAT